MPDARRIRLREVAEHPYPLAGDDNAEWWRGRCKTCKWFDPKTHGCRNAGEVECMRSDGSTYVRPLLRVFPAMRANCWEVAGG